MTDKLRNSRVGEMGLIVLRRQGDCVFEGDALSNNLHTHSYEICFVIKGSGVHLHGDETIAVAENDIFLAEPGIEHRVSAYENGHLHVAYFVFDLLSDIEKLQLDSVVSQFSERHCMIARNQSHLTPIVQQILNYFRMRGHTNTWVEAYAQLFILDALSSLAESSESPAQQHRVIDKAMAFIRSNLSWPPQLVQIANAAGTSPRNLQLLFRKYLDKSVMEFLNSERCELASQYLDMGFRVNQTGPIIGIDDPAQFSRFYKRYTGISPSERRSGGIR